MASRAARICGCSKVVPFGAVCPCQEKAARERKARFDAKRPSARERGYTAEWHRESRSFIKANPTCKRCGQAATLVDHIIPHKGNDRLFWDRSNWQPLCTPCHSSAKQRQERRTNPERTSQC